MYIIGLLKRNVINVILINIYFIVIWKVKRISPQSAQEWNNEINNMKKHLCIKEKEIGIYEIFIDVSS